MASDTEGGREFIEIWSPRAFALTKLLTLMRPWEKQYSSKRIDVLKSKSSRMMVKVFEVTELSNRVVRSLEIQGEF